MAEKQPKKPKASDEDGVLGTLPATRTARLSRRARPGDTPKPAAKTKLKAPAPGRAEPATVTAARPARPRPVRSAAENLAEPAKKAADKRPAEERSPSGTELVSTVVQAAGELAQVGLTVGGQILKRAVEKLPKP